MGIGVGGRIPKAHAVLFDTYRVDKGKKAGPPARGALPSGK